MTVGRGQTQSGLDQDHVEVLPRIFVVLLVDVRLSGVEQARRTGPHLDQIARPKEASGTGSWLSRVNSLTHSALV